MTGRSREGKEWRPARRETLTFFVALLYSLVRARIARDTLLGVVGLVGLGWETFGPRPTDALITVFAGFLGAPIFLRLDERRVHAWERREQERVAGVGTREP